MLAFINVKKKGIRTQKVLWGFVVVTPWSPIFSFFFKFSWRTAFMQGFIELWLAFQEIGVFQQNQFVLDKRWRHHNDYVTRAHISPFQEFLNDVLSSCKVSLIWKKSVGRSTFLSRTPGSKKRLKTSGQIELNMNFTYTKMFINCFSREQLPSIIDVELYLLSLRRFYFLPTFSCLA